MSVNAEPLLRSLPDLPEVLAKLQSGEYNLWGGVVRHAAGTGKGGQIVGHLLFPGDSYQTQQSLLKLQATLSNGLNTLSGRMRGLQQTMNVLQGLQSANLVMAGLNLAVTTSGFMVVCQKLNKIGSQIEEQSRSIAQTLSLVRDIHERDLLREEAKFRSLLLSSEQFIDQGDIDRLKALIPNFHEEYQFTKLVLSKHATIGASNVEHFSEIQLLQDRFVYLGLMMSHVQMKAGAANYGRQSLTQLAADIGVLNSNRVEALTSDRELASSISTSHFSVLTTFLKNGSTMVPALTYQADIIELETKRPGLIQQASESDEILLMAA
jgi:hypothetical protein